jgi:hypothetical protein
VGFDSEPSPVLCVGVELNVVELMRRRPGQFAKRDACSNSIVSWETDDGSLSRQRLSSPTSAHHACGHVLREITIEIELVLILCNSPMDVTETNNDRHREQPHQEERRSAKPPSSAAVIAASAASELTHMLCVHVPR